MGPGDVEGQGELQGEVAEMALTREDAEAGHIVRLRIDVVGVTAERAGGCLRALGDQHAVQWCDRVFGVGPYVEDLFASPRSAARRRIFLSTRAACQETLQCA